MGYNKKNKDNMVYFKEQIKYLLNEFGTKEPCNRFDVGNVIEFILAGASLVQIGTLNYTNPNIGVEIINNLKKYCSDNNIYNLSDLKGQIKYYE